MDGNKSPQPMSTGLQRVAEVARKHPTGRLWSLAHTIDVEALRGSFDRIRKDAAVGVDGVTKEAYGMNLEVNLEDLHRRMREMRYRHQPIRRVYIPKENGKQRPIGISTTEDKIVQGVLRELLEVIYEQEFLPCSYGFRPGRRAHDALAALDHAIFTSEARWILEFDIESFFDSVDRPALMEMLQKRINDKALMRLIGKCLHVGILDGEEFTRPVEGTVQGSVLSPILGNICLHHVLDLWFEKEVKPRMRGKATFIRYADDGVFGFECRWDAERMMEALPKRLERFHLRLSPQKTHLIDFRRPPPSQGSGKGHSTFDFLGFTFHWRRNPLTGHWSPKAKTRGARLARAKKAITAFCRRHRHDSVEEQHSALWRRLKGHYNYFGIKGNEDSLKTLFEHAKTTWKKWLNRRSQRQRLNWKRFLALLRDHPLPEPQAKLSLWATPA